METNNSTLPAILLEWHARTIPHHDRSQRWYVVGTIILIAGIVYGALADNWTFAILMPLIGGMYYILRHSVETPKHFSISELGFSLEDSFTSWKECTEFWFIPTPSYIELHILRKNGLDRETVIQTGSIDPIQIRATIGQFITERTDKHERLIDKIIRICKL